MSCKRKYGNYLHSNQMSNYFQAASLWTFLQRNSAGLGLKGTGWGFTSAAVRRVRSRQCQPSREAAESPLCTPREATAVSCLDGLGGRMELGNLGEVLRAGRIVDAPVPPRCVTPSLHPEGARAPLSPGVWTATGLAEGLQRGRRERALLRVFTL